MKLMVIVYATEMDRSVRFYEALGLTRVEGEAVDPMWNVFRLGDGMLALHGTGAGELPQSTGRVQVNLNVADDGSFDELHARCADLELEIGAGISDEGFGRFFWLRDPDGLPVQVNEAASTQGGRISATLP